MADNIKVLVRMTRQIAGFFRPYGDEKTVAGVAKHIRDFWTPVMRRQMVAHIENHPDELDPLVLKAFKVLEGERMAANAPQKIDEGAALGA
jgi:formate dehydrogenase subunit delta